MECNHYRDPNFVPAIYVALQAKYREQQEAIRKVVESIRTAKFTKKQALARPPHLDITAEEMTELLRAVEGEVKQVTAPVLGDSGDELETEERREAAKGSSQRTPGANQGQRQCGEEGPEEQRLLCGTGGQTPAELRTAPFLHI